MEAAQSRTGLGGAGFQEGETFIDYKGQLHEILYSILTPLGYQVHVSAQALQHIDKHPSSSKHKSDISHILNNPDLVTPNPEDPKRHIFYKTLHGKALLAVTVHMKNGIRYVTTMYTMPCIKGLRQKRLASNQFLYLRGGFKWKNWK